MGEKLPYLSWASDLPVRSWNGLTNYFDENLEVYERTIIVTLRPQFWSGPVGPKRL